MADATSARWPKRWRDCLFPVTCIRLCYWGTTIRIGPQDWSGHCWWAHIGPWMLLGGNADLAPEPPRDA